MEKYLVAFAERYECLNCGTVRFNNSHYEHESHEGDTMEYNRRTDPVLNEYLNKVPENIQLHECHDGWIGIMKRTAVNRTK
jgi:hypothetical protein